MTHPPSTKAPSASRLSSALKAMGLFVLVVAVASIVSGPERPLGPGEDTPHLHLTSYDGRQWDLERFAGKPILLNFWGTWCPPCLMELPHFVAASERFADDVVFIGAAVNSPRAEVFRTVKDLKVRYPIAEVDQRELGAWRANTLPTSILLDEQHRIVWSKRGAVSRETLEQVLTALKNGDFRAQP